MTKLHDLFQMGQSVWLDYILRSFIIEGEFEKLIELGVTGMTSNPTIFEKAILRSSDYDEQFLELLGQNKTNLEIYSALVIKDIQMAADVLYPVYLKTSKRDGYVSLEVNPLLAEESNATINEAISLWKLVNRPNLMIKIPATLQGLPAIEEVLANGINVNVTLIFSITRYKEVIDVFMRGLERRVALGQPIDHIHSVASFFVSRLDSKIDTILQNLLDDKKVNESDFGLLHGKAAVANARLAYQVFKEEFETPRFLKLNSLGGNHQRPLWASTSTKNPSYSDILYVQELIGALTVNTMSLDTINAYIDHGIITNSISNEMDHAEQIFNRLSGIGISYERITQELEEEGVSSFSNSFAAIMKSLEKKRLHFDTNKQIITR